MNPIFSIFFVHSQVSPWNQPVLNNTDKVPCSCAAIDLAVGQLQVQVTNHSTSLLHLQVFQFPSIMLLESFYGKVCKVDFTGAFAGKKFGE